ncbi:hypothetical protein IFM89_010143 [Coptis chinensis]|uniref:Ubiquitin-like domain-containing protein n=1 Tax=Coptis chinensis TaxID=261450 RepID=A0A835IA70_9MAGN|nr:hypothetical protein IFM89_010143 [Coptis chinensis]
MPMLLDGNEVFFRIKRSTQLRKLRTAYCDRQSVEFNSIALLFDGRRLRGEQTPDELEMEDGDEIDAMLHQTAEALAGQMTEENLEKRMIYPPISNIRKFSAHIAAKVAANAYELRHTKLVHIKYDHIKL